VARFYRLPVGGNENEILASSLRLWLVTGMWAGGLLGAEELVTIDFRNRIPGVLDTPVFDLDGTTRLDSRFLPQLYVSQTNLPSSFAPVGSAVYFFSGTNAGYWYDETPLEAVFSWRVGAPTLYQVRVRQWFPSTDIPRAVPRGGSPTDSLVVTNSPMPLIGLRVSAWFPKRSRSRDRGSGANSVGLLGRARVPEQQPEAPELVDRSVPDQS
jgi:hypothetical protein